jgi:hypothetical protein
MCVCVCVCVKKQMEVNQVSAITNIEYKNQKTTRFAESRNEKRLWAQHFGVSGFRILGFMNTMHKQNEIRNSELRNAIRVWAQQFRFSGFTNSRCKTLHNVKRRITKSRKGMGPNQYRVSVFGNN